MSRFGPGKFGKNTIDRSTSPRGGPSSPTTSPKKKAFVATIKSKESFGVPPPLPPVSTGSEDRSVSAETPTIDVGYSLVPEPDFLASSHIHLLQKQTVRWLNLTLNLWSLAVLDVHRAVDLASISQFLEVVSWRAHGKINEEEFSVLYSEWIGKQERNKLSVGTSSSLAAPRRVSVGVFSLRQLLLERKYGETDLDLCIGIIINEVNQRLLNSSVSFMGTASMKQNPFSLEVCSHKWLSLCEDLFFTLDTPGYGVLRFDEAFFLTTCFTIGLQGWNSEDELEADLSLATLTAQTLQFLNDTGANISIRSRHQLDAEYEQAMEHALSQQASSSSSDGGGHYHSGSRSQHSPNRRSAAVMSYHRNQHHQHALRQQLFNGKCEITLSMFKKYFLKRNVGEAALATLLSHVKTCVEKIVRLAKINNADELYHSCKPYEDLGSVGSARLWQQAVLSASGHAYQAPEHGGGGAAPSILVFLLSDADRLLSGFLRATELPIEGMAFSSSSASGSARDVASSPAEVSENSIQSPATTNEELHETVYHIWNTFRKWGTENINNQGTAEASYHQRMSASTAKRAAHTHINSDGGIADVQRDPIYQLILAVVLQYKSLQQLLIAAFFDMTLSHFGVGASGLSTAAANTLMVVCAGLVPDPHNVLLDLGFLDPEAEAQEQEAPPPPPPPPLQALPSHQLLVVDATSPSSTIASSNTTALRGQDDGGPATAAEMKSKYEFQSLESTVDSPVVTSSSRRPLSTSSSRRSSAPAFSNRAAAMAALAGSSGGLHKDITEMGRAGKPTNGASSSPLPPPRTRRPSRAVESDEEDDGGGDVLYNNSKDTTKKKVTTETAERSTSNGGNTKPQRRASQRIQAEREALRAKSSQSMEPVLLPSGASAGGDSELLENQQELSHAQWAPLFTSQQQQNDPTAAAKASSPIHRPSVARQVFPPVAAAAASAALAADSHTGITIDNTQPQSQQHSLSDEEAILLTEILRTGDKKRQNELIDKMKRLRMETAPVADSSSPVAVVVESAREEIEGIGKPALNTSIDNHHNSVPTAGVEESVVDSVPFAMEEEKDEENVVNAPVGPSSIEELLEQGNDNTGQYAQMLREILRKMSRDDSKLQLKSLEQVLQLGQSIAEQDDLETKRKEQLKKQQEIHASATPIVPIPTSSSSSSAPTSHHSGGTSGNSGADSGSAPPTGATSTTATGRDLSLLRRRNTTTAASSSSLSGGTADDDGEGKDNNRSSNNINTTTTTNNNNNNNNNTASPRAMVARSSSRAQQHASDSFTPATAGGGGGGGRGGISRLSKVPGQTPNPTTKKDKKVFGHDI